MKDDNGDNGITVSDAKSGRYGRYIRAIFSKAIKPMLNIIATLFSYEMR